VASAPRYSRLVADLIPGAEFVLLPEEAHQPFQERPEQYNQLVHEFWSRIEGTA
jgi:3-oxoadipate enol-lactonase